MILFCCRAIDENWKIMYNFVEYILRGTNEKINYNLLGIFGVFRGLCL